MYLYFVCSIHFRCVSIFGSYTDDDAMLDLRTPIAQAKFHFTLIKLLWIGIG